MTEKIDWSGNIRKRILEAIKQRGAGGFATVRSVYYYLGTLNVLPLTAQGYKQLDALVVKMRKNGEIPWGYFDTVRGVNGIAPDRYWDPKEFYNAYMNEFLGSSKYYRIPLWYRQGNHVEIWVEKKGLLHKVENYVRGLDVQVRAVEGYPPWEFVKENIDDIYEYLQDRDEDATVNILYLGDLDPSGLDIDRQIQEAFEHFEMDINFRRIGLLPEQVQQYNLPPIPENGEVLMKIHRDARYAKYAAEYGERFTELDAWDGISPKSMEARIRDEVWKLFDHSLDAQREKEQKEYMERLQKMLGEARKKLGA
jgi:hypothetical protein